MDARRLDDCTVTELLKAAAAASASAASTPSGEWTDISNEIGDLLLIVDVGSVTGSFGSVNVQVQVGSDNTGASPVNAVDPRGTLLTITAAGVYGIAIDADKQPKSFIGITTTFTTVTAAVMSCVMVGRGNIAANVT